MNAYVILIIVLTIGYILYYAAMITIDLFAKPKDEGRKEETISAGDMADDMGYTPKTVKESSDGSFSVTDTEPESPEQEEEHIDEAEQISEADEEQATSEEPEAVPEPEEPETDESHEEGDEGEKGEEQETGETEEAEATEETEEVSDEDAEIEGITSVPFVEGADVTVREEVDKSDIPAFDPNMNPPSYDVTEVIGGAQHDTDVSRKAELIHSSLSSIETNGNQFDSFDLRNILQNEERTNQECIEARHEATRT